MRTLFFALLFFAVPSFAQVPPCFDQIATTFFPYPLVAQALSMHRVMQDRWPIIYQDLQNRSAQIPGLVRARASQMVPNPLQPYQFLTAAALLKAVLEETFAQSLQVNYYNDLYNIHVMFEYIRKQQANRLLPCFGEGPLVDPIPIEMRPAR